MPNTYDSQTIDGTRGRTKALLEYMDRNLKDALENLASDARSAESNRAKGRQLDSIIPQSLSRIQDLISRRNVALETLEMLDAAVIPTK